MANNCGKVYVVIYLIIHYYGPEMWVVELCVYLLPDVK